MRQMCRVPIFNRSAIQPGVIVVSRPSRRAQKGDPQQSVFPVFAWRMAAPAARPDWACRWQPASRTGRGENLPGPVRFIGCVWGGHRIRPLRHNSI